MPATRNDDSPDRSGRPVAIVGASSDRTKFGNKAVRAYLEEGYTVWPVNPKGGVIEGLPVHRDLADLPDFPHRVSIYLHERPALDALDTLAEMQRQAGRKIPAVYLNPGADTPAVVARADELGLKHFQACSIRAIGRTPGEFTA